MGIFGSMLTAVTGLRSQAFALENISSNIANSQTVGYKRVDTSFSDLVSDQPLNAQMGGTVRSMSRGTNTIAGNYTSTGISTNAALNGDGFFVVRQRVDSGGRGAVFNPTDVYTRRGDFAVDRDGYLVNGSGGYLIGTGVDRFTGVSTGSAPDVIRVMTDQVPPSATTKIEYRGNLPSYPKTGKADPTLPGSELLSPTGFAVNPNTPTGVVSANEESSFLNQTVPGGSITLYDGLGTPVTMEARWGKTANAAGTTPDTWQLFYKSDANATGAATKWTNAGTPFTFNSSTQLTSPASGATIPNLTINGTKFGNVGMTLGLTQASALTGQVQTTAVRQDGYSSGDLSGITMSDDGRVVANYSNGATVALAQVSVAQFNAANMLKRLDGGTFEATIESGSALLGMNGTTLASGQIEASNTDIAEEFSKMIITQQAYSANTRVVTTAQQMLQDTINIVR